VFAVVARFVVIIFSHWIYLTPDPLIVGIRVLRFLAENTLIQDIIDEQKNDTAVEADREHGNQSV
jgi:hypothetical protein